VVEVIAGAAAAQVVKEQMEREAHVERAPARAHVRRPARTRLALAGALRRAAARLERPVVAR
jgi:hypothetical protein